MTTSPRSLRILCAEDDPHISELLRLVLTRAGHEVECVCNGKLAWERIVSDLSHFQLLLTDNQMPEMNGLELVRKLRETAFQGRIVSLSGNLSPADEALFRGLKVEQFLRKPIGADSLTQLIDRLVEERLLP